MADRGTSRAVHATATGRRPYSLDSECAAPAPSSIAPSSSCSRSEARFRSTSRAPSMSPSWSRSSVRARSRRNSSRRGCTRRGGGARFLDAAEVLGGPIGIDPHAVPGVRPAEEVLLVVLQGLWRPENGVEHDDRIEAFLAGARRGDAHSLPGAWRREEPRDRYTERPGERQEARWRRTREGGLGRPSARWRRNCRRESDAQERRPRVDERRAGQQIAWLRRSDSTSRWRVGATWVGRSDQVEVVPVTLNRCRCPSGWWFLRRTDRALGTSARPAVTLGPRTASWGRGPRRGAGGPHGSSRPSR